MSNYNFVPKRETKNVISLRLPSELLEEIDEKATAVQLSRNQLVVQALEFALAHMKIENDSE